tara:strand:+ start:1201 stop:1638 length:438 start_codon:yes stop_codon:yes gene_type:complete
MKIILAADHAGFELKEKIKQNLLNRSIGVKDFGAMSYNSSDDYPDFIIPAAKFLSKNTDYLGIILGGSGQGEAIAANRVNGIRAVVYYGGSLEIIKLSRMHNNANILSLGARFVKEENIMKVIDLWLNTDFEGDRHLRRIKKLDI